MTKTELAKQKQEYTPKFIPGTCGNCAHRVYEMNFPAWMKKPGIQHWDEKYKVETNQRCGIGGFAVKKLGSCAEWAGINAVEEQA